MTRVETIVTADEHGVVHLDLALGPDSAGAQVQVVAQAQPLRLPEHELPTQPPAEKPGRWPDIASMQGAWLGEFEEMPDPPPEDDETFE